MAGLTTAYLATWAALIVPAATGASAVALESLLVSMVGAALYQVPSFLLHLLFSVSARESPMADTSLPTALLLATRLGLLVTLLAWIAWDAIAIMRGRLVKDPPPRRASTALALLLMWGGFGAHRFYLGHAVSGTALLSLTIMASVAALLLSNSSAGSPALANFSALALVGLMFEAADFILSPVLAVIGTPDMAAIAGTYGVEAKDLPARFSFGGGVVAPAGLIAIDVWLALAAMRILRGTLSAKPGAARYRPRP